MVLGKGDTTDLRGKKGPEDRFKPAIQTRDWVGGGLAQVGGPKAREISTGTECCPTTIFVGDLGQKKNSKKKKEAAKH